MNEILMMLRQFEGGTKSPAFKSGAPYPLILAEYIDGLPYDAAMRLRSELQSVLKDLDTSIARKLPPANVASVVTNPDARD